LIQTVADTQAVGMSGAGMFLWRGSICHTAVIVTMVAQIQRSKVASNVLGHTTLN